MSRLSSHNLELMGEQDLLNDDLEDKWILS